MQMYNINETSALLGTLNRTLHTEEDEERGFMGAILNKQSRIATHLADIPPEALGTEYLSEAYKVICEMNGRDDPIDTTTLTGLLRSRGLLEKIGGASEVAGWFLQGTTEVGFRYYVDKILNQWTMRKAITAFAQGLDLLLKSQKGPDDASSVIAEAVEIIRGATGEVKTNQRSKTVSQAVGDHCYYMDELMTGKRSQIPLGLPSFDSQAGGIGDDEYCLIAGPTKSGKTVFAQKIFVAAMDKGFISTYYSGEVSSTTMGGRLIYSRGHVSAKNDRHGLHVRADQDAYKRSVLDLQQNYADRGYIVDAQGMSVEELVADMRLKAAKGSRLFIFDYLAKFSSRQKFQSREREMSYMSSLIFQAGKQLRVATVVLSQLNDEGQIRESRGLEHDCDIYLKIFGASDVNTKEPIPDRRLIQVERGRSIASGYRIECRFDGEHYSMHEIERTNKQQPTTYRSSRKQAKKSHGADRRMCC